MNLVQTQSYSPVTHVFVDTSWPCPTIGAQSLRQIHLPLQRRMCRYNVDARLWVDSDKERDD